MQRPGMTDGTPAEEWWRNFQSLLEEQVEWPSEYVFKFIVPAERADQLRALLTEATVTERESSKGTYLSVTATMQVESSDEVIQVYRSVADVEGVISL